MGVGAAATPTVNVNVGNYVGINNAGPASVLQPNNVDVRMGLGSANVATVNGFSGKNIGTTYLDQDNVVYGKIGTGKLAIDTQNGAELKNGFWASVDQGYKVSGYAVKGDTTFEKVNYADVANVWCVGIVQKNIDVIDPEGKIKVEDYNSASIKNAFYANVDQSNQVTIGTQGPKTNMLASNYLETKNVFATTAVQKNTANIFFKGTAKVEMYNQHDATKGCFADTTQYSGLTATMKGTNPVLNVEGYNSFNPKKIWIVNADQDFKVVVR
jgi:hypothetical protein